MEDIFKEIMAYIVQKDNVDLNHLYIDGSKFEATPTNTLGYGRNQPKNTDTNYSLEDNSAI